MFYEGILLICVFIRLIVINYILDTVLSLLIYSDIRDFEERVCREI